MPNLEKSLESGIAPFVMRNVPNIENTSTVDVAVANYNATPSGSVLIVDSGTHMLSGIITGSDLTKLRHSKTAEDLATMVGVVAIKENAQLWQLLKIMNGENALNRPLNSLPVVDVAGKPVGVVQREQLVRRLAEFEKA